MRAFSIAGAPDHELNRSPAACRVGDLAAQSGLFLYHYEYRVVLPPPEAWIPEGRVDLGHRQPWHNGVLAESKYHGFRNDLMIGSFHPGHRAKWTAHELCHGLVGFAWRPGASPFFHALAARLSELLPVALFYFFDEAGLNRCEDHQGQGPLFGTFCPACEHSGAQAALPLTDADHRWYKDGLAFIDRELAAVARSLKLGRPISSPWAAIDLCSDGLAYASAQSRRLASPQFERFAAQFFPADCGLHGDLESLMARVTALAADLTGGEFASPLKGHRQLWMVQDLAWRLFEVQAETEGDARRALDDMIDLLAANPGMDTIRDVAARYHDLFDAYYVPDPSLVLGVGYELGQGFGRNQAQILDGLQSACPNTCEVLDNDGELQETVKRFVLEDAFVRKPLGLRFSSWLQEVHPVRDLAAAEAGLVHAPVPDAARLSLQDGHQPKGDDLWQLASDARLITCSAQVMNQLGLDVPPDQADTILAIQKRVDGETDLHQLSPQLGAALAKLAASPACRDRVALSDGEWSAALEAGLLMPVRWRL